MTWGTTDVYDTIEAKREWDNIFKALKKKLLTQEF
jgi:hypothetical protein